MQLAFVRNVQHRHRRKEIRGCLGQGGESNECGVIAKVHGVSFWADENLLNLHGVPLNGWILWCELRVSKDVNQRTTGVSILPDWGECEDRLWSVSAKAVVQGVI